jgi:nitrogen fixation/metabolism regulation signal transduction histidine kinase
VTKAFFDDLVFEEARRLRASTGLRVDTTAVSAGRVDGDAAGLRRVLRNLDDARARDDGGSGLGLAIVAELATAHGGTVAVAPSALGGARVEVTLPRLADPGD